MRGPGQEFPVFMHFQLGTDVKARIAAIGQHLGQYGSHICK